jgi:hypothetical protein
MIRGVSIVLIGAALAAATSGCGGSRCTTGESASCACADGREGAQICQDDGTFDPCVCGSGSGSGSGSTGGGEGNPYAGAWSQFTITPSTGTYYLGAFEIDAAGNFGAGPDASSVSWTVTGTVTPSGEVSGTANAPGWDKTYAVSGTCQTTSFCSGTVSNGGALGNDMGLFQMKY